MISFTTRRFLCIMCVPLALSGCVPVTTSEDAPASQEVPPANDSHLSATCPFGEFLENGTCSSCPRQAQCCGRSFWFSEDDELCHLIPDGCRDFAASQTDVVCIGFANDVEIPLTDDGAPNDNSEETSHVVLRIDSIGPGAVILSPRGTPEGGGFQYASQTVVTLTATPDSGFVFEGWTGNLSSPDSIITLTLLVDTQLTATFGDPPFAPGDIFSFLSVPETDFFDMIVSAANDEITRWHQDELRRIAAELASRGFSSGGSLGRQLGCDSDKEAVRMRRDATWQILDEHLGFSRFTLFSIGVADEVEAWNCQRYPDPTCSLFSTCR